MWYTPDTPEGDNVCIYMIYMYDIALAYLELHERRPEVGVEGVGDAVEGRGLPHEAQQLRLAAVHRARHVPVAPLHAERVGGSMSPSGFELQ